MRVAAGPVGRGVPSARGLEAGARGSPESPVGATHVPWDWEQEDWSQR